MSWQQIAPGQYQRPFDTSERLYRGIAASAAHLGKQHWLVASAIQFKEPLSTSNLQRAWAALRHQHPHIMAVADESGSCFQYTVPSPLALKEWTEQTLLIHPIDETRPAEMLESDLEPTDLFVLHYLPRSKELLFRAPHWRTDARGMLLLQHQYLTLLAVGTVAGDFDGSEVSRLAPPFDLVAGLSTEITPEMGAASDAVLGVLFSGSTPASVKECLPTSCPKRSRRGAIYLPRDLTTEIINASRARGQSVTTTVHAALVMAMRKHVDISDGRLMGFNPFDVRDRLPAPWNTAAGCASLYHTGKPCSVDLVQYPDFDAVAMHLSTFYTEDLQPLFGHMIDYHRKIGDIMSVPLEAAMQMPGAARPELSSLGVVDRFLQTSYTGSAGVFEIEGWWLGVQMINRLLQMYLWTRDGRMQLGCNYNEAFYTPEFVELFLGEWMKVLVEELGIEN
ncbi:hypothetical protein BJX63DRAFT_432306 [Aspergillus granulosus]|uniref:Condensation domain-containing protein n=1 Tax=Aspergillus granulosus TaxID=176169 RepID=A0ABR4HC22_9EURO